MTVKISISENIRFLQLSLKSIVIHRPEINRLLSEAEQIKVVESRVSVVTLKTYHLEIGQFCKKKYDREIKQNTPKGINRPHNSENYSESDHLQRDKN